MTYHIVIKMNGLFIILILALIIIVIANKNTNNILVQQKMAPESSFIKHFGVVLQVADLPTKYYEGGFHLYFHSPELKIRKLIADTFDSGQSIQAVFDLEGRRITPRMFQQAMETSYLKSHSNNIYNASQVKVYGVTDSDYYFNGSKNLDPNLDRNINNHHIYLDKIAYQLRKSD